MSLLANEDSCSIKAHLREDICKCKYCELQFVPYSKVPKFSDTRNLCCDLPKIQTKKPNLRVFCQKDANGIANSVDPDQTAPLGAV